MVTINLWECDELHIGAILQSENFDDPGVLRGLMQMIKGTILYNIIINV